MMTEEEGWITYGLKAIENLLQQGILWKPFRETFTSFTSDPKVAR